MKRKAITLFLSMAIAMSAIGCGRANNNQNNTGSVDNTENQGAGTVGSESMVDNTEMGTESDFNQLQLGNALELPEGFDGAEGETDAHGELEQVIAQHCNIAEENYQSITYYYNYVDLNGDSKNEILAMVMGESFNQQGGNRLLWLDASGDNLTTDSIIQEFTGVSAPVYISNHMTEGYRDLILCNNIGINNDITQENLGTQGTETQMARSNEVATSIENGSGSNGYVLLVWKGDKYQELQEGTVLTDLQGYEGTAIITNNINQDLMEDTYHFLGEAMNL